MIRQLEKSGVTVQTGVTAAPEQVKAMKPDAVFVAIGPTFKRPDIPGADGENVKVPMEVFGHTEDLPERIVIMGGSETAVETGIYLARNGKQVKVLSRQSMLASDAPHAHYISMLEDAYKNQPGFSWETDVREYISIAPEGVTYVNGEGKTCREDARLVVCSTGTSPQHADAAGIL